MNKTAKKVIDELEARLASDNFLLTSLRNLSCELGLELIYYRDKTIERITHENFVRDQKVGLARNGDLFLLPIKPRVLVKKMERAILRKRRIDERGSKDNAE